MKRRNIPGLLGSDGVLPRCITARVAEYAQVHQQCAPQDFFRIFDKCCDILQSNIDKKQRVTADSTPETLPLTRLLQGLMPEDSVCYPGIGMTLSGNVRLRALSRLASAYFAQRTDFHYAPPVRVPYTPRAGTERLLGGGAMLGSHCLLRTAHLVMTIYADSLRVYDEWQPGGLRDRLCGQFLRTFLRRPVLWQVIIRPSAALILPAQLAVTPSLLGRNICL